ncbi:hypothetical protein N656DRAFT_795922 [Canariomyces notabilis]|uniref:ADF-H domain-containing protein n=1 Tax=Canariomyces notabilis TaxID=2074819 RepID=A0AAN6YVF2_9PEZI|nr:hypothetical protein N656DRAFT_795922 [Canariomyces arenarius]
MSLNGLDDPRVKEAYEAAAAEPGGWFLLKYASRDEVELLGRGNGGIVEIRNNIAQYEEKSPLYGFLRYRRRNVIIKYLPEDCSRLIQARVAVHFTAVCDRFSPHDTTFSIAESKELKDTKLSAACSLHTASGSTSSSTSSLRRRRLMEIAEEEEEEARERKRQSLVKEEERHGPSAPLTSEPPGPAKLNADLANLPEAARFTSQLEPPVFTGVPRPSSPAKSFDEAARRMLSQSSRHELYPTSSYPYSKPRVKLGPRPSVEISGRPRSAAGGAANRPVSTVPAGLKSLSKGSRKGRTHEHDEEAPESELKEEPKDPFQQSVAGFNMDPSDGEPARPHTSSGAHAAIATPSPLKINMPAIALPPNKQSTMTPEKARLLKAMKLREQKKVSNLQSTLDLPAPDMPSAPGVPDESDNTNPETRAISPLAEDTLPEANSQQNDGPSDLKADPEPDFDAEPDRTSVDTHTDSHPASPLAASDIGDSTQASSLSESTDETLLAKDQGPSQEAEADTQIAAIADNEILPLEKGADAAEVGLTNGDSENDKAAMDGRGRVDDEGPAVVKEDIEQENGTSNPTPDGEADRSSAISEKVEKDTSNDTLSGAVDAQETKVSHSNEEQTPSSPQIRIPLSKFSTQEAKSPTAAANQAISPSAARSPDMDRWSIQDAAPPVPDKDDAPKTGNDAEGAAAEAKPSRRNFPGPIRTDLDALEKDKRRSVISITENDGLMDELQSATVQQATPIAVSKSSMNPFFSADAGYKKTPGGVERPGFSRAVSNPGRSSLLPAGEAPAGTGRSVSTGTAYLNKISQQTTPSDLRPKSAKLGSSISQRIKALEMLSGSASPSDTAPKERPATTFFAVRKANTREQSKSPSVVDRANSLTRGPTPTPPESMESSPETTRAARRDRSGSLVNRLSMFEGGNPPRGRPESIQVKARIIRDPNQPFPKVPEPRADAADYGPLELKQSPLIVDIQSRAVSQSPARPLSSVSTRQAGQELASQAKQSLLERRLSRDSRSQSQDPDKEGTDEEAKQQSTGPRPRRRSSLSVVKDFIKDRGGSLIGVKSPSTDNLGRSPSPAPTSLVSPAMPTSSQSPSRPPSVHQTVSLARRLSISSRRSSIEQATPAFSVNSAAILSPARTPDAGGESETDVKGGGKKSGPPSPNQSKGSRASRFMRRLSNTLVTSKKNSAPSSPPTVAEEDAAEVEAASRSSTAQSQPSIVAFMGDVNVQFPDNLLWKRRSICLDSQGFLILSAVQGTPMMPAVAPGKDRQQTGLVKRYHMSDFKAPYAPDVELQELPNSVVLNLVDGSGLQIACEDRAGQMSILRILEEAHHNHTSFGQ